MYWCAVVATLLPIAGCQTDNSQRDLIARDRRMQEDQVYAMQDYVRQYQNLVCQYRSENASLRRQLAQSSDGGPDQSEPQPMPATRRPSAPSAPQFQTPQTPGGKRQPPEDPQIDVPAVPDVPPLKSSAWNSPNHDIEIAPSNDSGQSESDPQVLTATYEEPVKDRGPAEQTRRRDAEGKAETADRAGTARLSSETNDVMLSGEVLASEPGGGQRLVVDVAPFDKSGRVESFDGSASVMLLEPTASGERRALGRWDFGREYVRSTIDTTSSEPTMRFQIELPEGTAVGENSQLWVRLVSSDGAKLLSHANVDLTKPGQFASNTNRIWPSEETVVAASYEEPANPAEQNVPSADVAASLTEGHWAVAAPGQPSNLPEGFDTEAKGWRASNESIPPVMANVVEVSPRESLNKLRDEIRHTQQETASNKNKVAEKVKEKAPVVRPGWAPERPGQSPQRMASRPNWSAKR